MSLNRSTGGLDEEDYYYFKVYKVLVCEARIILYYIFNCTCQRDLNQSFQIHAKTKLKMSNREFKKNFNKTVVELMDENPSGDRFDVSLLNACIIASDMETLIKPIKTFRNNIIHNTQVKDEATMNTLIQQLRDMLVNAIKTAGELYNCPNTEVEDKIKQLDENIKLIKECPINNTDVNTYKQDIEEIRKANETLVEVKGVSSLKGNFKELSYVDPASWISGKERLNVKMVFTRLDIIAKTEAVNSCNSISHEGLLELQTEDGKKPTVIVVEGDAGSGKSTLAKFILADWADLDPSSPSPTIRGLEQYDLVLYVECKNRNISRFVDLLQTLMPQVSYDMTDDDLLLSVLTKRTLVVVDGLDEINMNSKMLLKEMLGDCVKRSGEKIDFIITTRPQEMKSIPNLCGNNLYVHIRITGIPPERRAEFVERLHDEMIKEKQSDQNTSRLVDYVKQSQSRLGEHYRWPLNLTLLTYLWANDPDTVNSVTSATSLYVEVLKLLESRVICRIKDTQGSVNGLEDKVTKFLEILYAVYLKTHQLGLMQLSDECQKQLETECAKLGLPFDDMCGAFFSVDNQWTYKGNQMYLLAPHKSIMEFFSAYKFFNCLTAVGDYQMFDKELRDLVNKYNHIVDKKDKEKLLQVISKPKPKTLKNVLENLLSENDDEHTINFSHYQNALLHLGGLMALKDKDALQQYGHELVHILQQSNMTEVQWLDLIAEAECDPAFTSLVAQQIKLRRHKLVVRDGHTGAALEILKYLDKTLAVQVILESEVRYIPKIEALIEKLSERVCKVDLFFKNHWKNPQNGISTELLKKLFQKNCCVMRFTGNLDDLRVLPDSVIDIRLTVADDQQAQQICDGIAALEAQLNLKNIVADVGLHVMKKVSPDVLKPLPVANPAKKQCGIIWLSGVGDDDVSWACNIAKALLPQNMQFRSIIFPRCLLSLKGFQDLLMKLKEEGVAVSNSVKTDSTSIVNLEVNKLKDFTVSVLNCQFKWVEESSLW